MIFLLIFLFLVLSWAPFLPGLLELIRRRDISPLYIDNDFIRNPRYFSQSFKKKLLTALGDSINLPGFHEVKLSRAEKVEVVKECSLSDQEQKGYLLVVHGNLKTGFRTTFEREAYVKGSAEIGRMNKIRGLAAEGSVHLGPGSRIDLWIDTEKSLVVEKSCILGAGASSLQQMSLEEGGTFKRLFGDPITTWKNEESSRQIFSLFPEKKRRRKDPYPYLDLYLRDWFPRTSKGTGKV